MTRAMATSAMSPPDSERSGMCSSKRSAAPGASVLPGRRRSQPARRGLPHTGTGEIVREITGCASIRTLRSKTGSSRRRTRPSPGVAPRCDSGEVTTLHPVRPAPPPGADPRREGGVLPGAELLASMLAGTSEDERPVTHVHHVPVRESRTQPWPEWVSPALRARLEDRGVQALFQHQVAAAELARTGRHVVVATGTASGKSLAYQLPALTRLTEDPRACVLYLAPTKALARDQLASVAELADPSVPPAPSAGDTAPAGPPVRPAPCDGDAPRGERDWVRRHSRWIVTNPDMLHRGILPAHQRWSSTLRRLAYVVVDEGPAYRGVFGPPAR